MTVLPAAPTISEVSWFRRLSTPTSAADAPPSNGRLARALRLWGTRVTPSFTSPPRSSCLTRQAIHYHYRNRNQLRRGQFHFSLGRRGVRQSRLLRPDGLVDQPWKIMPIAHRRSIGQSTVTHCEGWIRCYRSGDRRAGVRVVRAAQTTTVAAVLRVLKASASSDGGDGSGRRPQGGQRFAVLGMMKFAVSGGLRRPGETGS